MKRLVFCFFACKTAGFDPPIALGEHWNAPEWKSEGCHFEINWNPVGTDVGPARRFTFHTTPSAGGAAGREGGVSEMRKKAL